MTSSDSEERRRANRLAIQRLVVLYHPGVKHRNLTHNQSPRKAVGVDLSSTGLKVITLNPIDPGVDLRLTLRVPALKQEIVVRGEVKRCVELPPKSGSPPTFELGVKIFQAGLEYHDFLEVLKTNHMIRLGDV